MDTSSDQAMLAIFKVYHPGRAIGQVRQCLAVMYSYLISSDQSIVCSDVYTISCMKIVVFANYEEWKL